jgi:hypothetical protein
MGDKIQDFEIGKHKIYYYHNFVGLKTFYN